MSKEEFVILVDENDRQTGICEKLEAHEKGLLHRAFSIFLFNKDGDLLLQQRALEKYHTGGLWTNTCCSHPRPDENQEDALQRKLFQEMGINCPLTKIFEFTYSADLDRGLTENELDHVYIGEFSDAPNPNPAEVKDWKYVSLNQVKKEIQADGDQFTPWFKMLITKVEEHFEELKTN